MIAKRPLEYGDVSDKSLSLKTYVMTVIAGVMIAIVYLSMTFLFNAFFTHSAGYDLYQKNEDGSLTLIERHYYEEGEGPEPALDEDELEENNQTYQIFRSELEGGALVAYLVIAQGFSLLLLCLFPFNLLRERGEKDRTLVAAGVRSEDTRRGLRIGLFAAIPAAAVYVVWMAFQIFGEPTKSLFTFYRMANIAFDQLILRMMPTGSSSSVVPYLVCLLLVLILPACATLAYTMGYRNIHPIRRLIYRNKKS